MPIQTHQDNHKPANAGRRVAPHMYSVGQLGQAMPEAMAYNAHHFNCPQCIAAGRVLNSNQRRCEVGNPLWQAYVQAVVSAQAPTSDAHQRSGAALGGATPHGNYGGNVSASANGATK